MSKPRKIVLGIVLGLIVAYVIFSIVVYINSKSPSSFNDFPSEGVWIATEDDFQIKLDLSTGSVGSMITTLIVNDKEYDVSVSISGGHGTFLVPTAPAKILSFEADVGEEKLHFSVSKYDINENDFFLLDIYTYENNTFNYIKSKMNLHFFKQDTDSSL